VFAGRCVRMGGDLAYVARPGSQGREDDRALEDQRALRTDDVRTERVKIPHVGWNTLEPTGRPSRLLDGLPDGVTAYFTHSYAAPIGEETVATTTHGAPFASVVERERVFGAQFHPEKSGVTGVEMLRRFVDVVREANTQC
jgi:imidazole glycerol phosphate synthase glutamine amidotransferase subunit